MAQVLTSEGLAEFYAGAKVPEFVKPEAEKPKEEAKPEPKVEAEKKPSPASKEPKVDEEDDQGLTPAERTEYSEKIARKISAKHRALKQAEAAIGTEAKQRQAAEKLASELKAEIAKLKESAIPDDGKGPKRSDFENDADWWDAKIDWKAEQKAEAKFTALEAKRAKESAEAAKHERIAKFATTVDDYDEVVDSLKGVPQHQAVIDYMSDADLGPALIYYFGSHPDEYEKIARLKPVFAVAEVGKIETRLERKAEKVDKTEKADEALETFKAPISRAPAPITPISDSATAVNKDPSKMSFDELRAHNRELRMKQAR